MAEGGTADDEHEGVTIEQLAARLAELARDAKAGGFDRDAIWDRVAEHLWAVTRPDRGEKDPSPEQPEH